MYPRGAARVVRVVVHGLKGCEEGSGQGKLGDVAGELKVIHRNVPLRVGVGDEAALKSQGEAFAPQVGIAGGAEEDSPHAFARGVVGARPRRSRRSNFQEVCRARRQAAEEETPVVELIMDRGGEAKAGCRGRTRKGLGEQAEQAVAPREDGGNTAEDAAERLPVASGGVAPGAREGGEHGVHLGAPG